MTTQTSADSDDRLVGSRATLAEAHGPGCGGHPLDGDAACLRCFTLLGLLLRFTTLVYSLPSCEEVPHLALKPASLWILYMSVCSPQDSGHGPASAPSTAPRREPGGLGPLIAPSRGSALCYPCCPPSGPSVGSLSCDVGPPAASQQPAAFPNGLPRPVLGRAPQPPGDAYSEPTVGEAPEPGAGTVETDLLKRTEDELEVRMVL